MAHQTAIRRAQQQDEEMHGKPKDDHFPNNNNNNNINMNGRCTLTAERQRMMMHNNDISTQTYSRWWPGNPRMCDSTTTPQDQNEEVICE
jgi:hypothetical protein